MTPKSPTDPVLAEPDAYRGWYRQMGIALRRLDWLPPLLARLWLGGSFLWSGYHQATHAGDAVTHFARLGIPAPGFFVPLVSAVELACGALLLVGLLTRLAAIPLIVTMVVATITAKIPQLKRPGDFLLIGEALYVLLLTYLVIDGPGRVSLDARLEQRTSETTPPAEIHRPLPPASGRLHPV
jgi:uncharacterized membrane protein YphA (DoxX/SURF4 family)